MNKLPNIPQEWFEDNRQRFKAETISAPIFHKNTHKHQFYRKTPIEIACRTCNKVWRDMGVIKF